MYKLDIVKYRDYSHGRRFVIVLVNDKSLIKHSPIKGYAVFGLNEYRRQSFYRKAPTRMFSIIDSVSNPLQNCHHQDN